MLINMTVAALLVIALFAVFATVTFTTCTAFYVCLDS